MELYIDGRRADLDSGARISVSLSVASVTSPEFGRTGYSKSMTIPMTARNREIMGDCEQIHSRDNFNSVLHTARVESDGYAVMDGLIVLTGSSCEAHGAGSYNFNIIGSGKAWAAHAAARRLSSLFPDFSMVINGQTIRKSWTADTPVRFLPVQREYHKSSGETGMQQAERVLSASDYHPFIHVRTLVDAVFADAGFAVISDFMDSAYFKSLYMSGNFPTRDVVPLKRRMDFLASRFDQASAVADSGGRVYADPYRSLNSVGNIVDTADPRDSSEGSIPEGVFTNNGCFCKRDKLVAFVPVHKVTAGFEYRLRYITDYRMTGSRELSGFSTVCLGNGDLRTFKISNRFKDRRGEFRSEKSFKWMIFNFSQGYVYELMAERKDASGSDTVTLAVSETLTGEVYTARSGEYSNLRMVCYAKKIDSTRRPYTGDWALYDGYVGQKGSAVIELALRSAPETITPGRPKYFDGIYFEGAAGMNFTLLSATVRPLFHSHPAEGSKVTFKEVAVHGCSRLDVIKSLGQMFNLCFYTDNMEKKVYIEPREEFHAGPLVTDWRDRVDFSKPYVVEELGGWMARRLSFGYRSGDEAVERFNILNNDDYGLWSARLDNANASTNEKIFMNPLFTPSLNITDCLSSAPSASLLQAGDGYGGDDLNFPPKIIHYMGMSRLPDDQKWGWPSYGDNYPMAAFYRSGMTLCFEDRDGLTGLHRFWDRNMNIYNNSRRLTIWIRLEPPDIEAIVYPNRLKRDFRALFLLTIDGEQSYWRLEELCDYDPTALSVKCVFIKETEGIKNVGLSGAQ